MTRLTQYARRTPSSAIGQVMQEAAALGALALFLGMIAVLYGVVNG